MIASVYTLSPDLPFADTLAKKLLRQAGGNPLALARMRILLPSRRSIVALREAFLRCSQGVPLLLPHMQPIGDVDEEELTFTAWQEAGNLAPAIPASRRILLLAMLIWRFQQQQYGRQARMDQAVQLAQELAVFLDDMAREGCDPSGLRGIVPEELATHWQITVDFLNIILQAWPQILQEEQKLDPVERRNLLLHGLAEHWRTTPPDYPVIAAGTTGSMPATAVLLKVIAGMKNGMVILPGLDRDMPEHVWNALDETHPQYGMKQLLATLEVPLTHVRPFGNEAPSSPRTALLRHALRPASTSDDWQNVKLPWQEAVRGCFRVDCATVQEEAAAIALLLRDTLETPGKTAALVTPNRELGRRVASILKRCHIEIDDSAGMPLSHTPAGTFLQLLVDAVAGKAAPVALLALLKHPLALAGLPAGTCRHQARLLEKAVLRGVRLSEGLAAIKEEAGHLPEHERTAIEAFIERIAAIIVPLEACFSSSRLSLRDMLSTHIEVAEALSRDVQGAAQLWQGESGEALAGYIHEILESAEGIAAIETGAYPALLTVLLAAKVWRPAYGMHPRLRILSPIEARLQQYDRIILGGLNEGSWPQDAGQDPWMSRPMRRAFGLSVPERQVGLAAHDFSMLAAAPEVFLTRAGKEGGSPSVPSRWLLRIEAVLGVLGGDEAVKTWRESGAQWRQWAQQWDMPQEVESCTAPMPAPPLEARPRQLYVTRMETLLRNPYAVYAREILKLKPLDELDKDPGAADFGTLIHDAIEKFIGSDVYQHLPEDAVQHLLNMGREVFGNLLERPAVAAFWWPRFVRIAEWLVETERNRKPDIASVKAEQEMEYRWQAPAGEFTLKARMDRLETWRDGSMRIIDYKTGAPPSSKDLERGIACQLLLEAVMVAATCNIKISDLEYWRVRGGKSGSAVESIAEKAEYKKASLEAWVENALMLMQETVAAYDDPATPYPHCPDAEIAPGYNDYEHLSRAREWGGVTVERKG